MKKIVIALFSATLVLATMPGCERICSWLKCSDCSSCCGHAHKKGHAHAAASAVQEIGSEAAFDQLLAGTDKLVVVKLGAPWCGACETMQPIFAKVAATMHDNVVFAEIDTDKVPEVPKRLETKGIPVIHFFKDGKELANDKIVGTMAEEAFVAHIQRLQTAK